MAEAKTKKDVAKLGDLTEATQEGVIVVDYETPKKASQVETTLYIQKNLMIGVPTIDGQKRYDMLVYGVNKQDVEAGIRTIMESIDMQLGDVESAKWKLYKGGITTAMGIKPEEEVTVEDIEMQIDYTVCKIYTLSNEEVANLDDLSEEVRKALNKEAVKAMLVDRAKLKIAGWSTVDEEDEDEDDYDY